MGPFFYSKKEIPAKSLRFKFFNNLIFLFDMPPKATIFLSVKADNNLNLYRPKIFIFLDDKKILLTFCDSLTLISLRL